LLSRRKVPIEESLLFPFLLLSLVLVLVLFLLLFLILVQPACLLVLEERGPVRWRKRRRRRRR